MFGLWMLFVSRWSWTEAIAGLLAAVIATIAATEVWLGRLVDLRANWRNVIELWRMPKYALTGSWDILVVLVRHLLRIEEAPSLMFWVPFDVGDEDGEASMRRALAIAYTTMTPNFVVVGIDRENRRLVFHQMRKRPLLEMTKRLGARP